MLIVKVISINSPIKKSDFISKNDFRVEIEYNKKVYTTNTQWNTENPQWNEIFIFNNESIDTTIKIENTLKVRLYEENIWSKSNLLEEESINIDSNNINYIVSNVLIECNLIDRNLNSFLLAHDDCEYYKEKLDNEVEKNNQLNNTINDLNEYNNELKTQYDYLNAVITNFTNEVSKINKNLK